MDPITIVIIFACIIFLILFLWLVPIGIWFQALISGVHTSLIQLIFMRFRKVPPAVIVNNMVSAAKAGLKVSQNELEAHYLAGGRVNSVVKALISADKANMNLDFKTCTAIDLAGRDVLNPVQTSVNPKVIDTPPRRYRHLYRFGNKPQAGAREPRQHFQAGAHQGIGQRYRL